MKKVLFSMAVIAASFTQAQITIGTGSLSAYAPIYPFYNNGYSQSFYGASAIGPAGTITGLRYKVTTGTTLAKSSTVDVYVGHTTKPMAANSSDWVPVEQLAKVFSGTISVAADNTVTISFATPFAYDGASNLVIAVDENKAGYDSSAHKFLGSSSATGSVIYKASTSDSSNIDPAAPGTGNLNNILPNVTLLGISAPATAPACSSVVSPANGARNVTFLPKVTYTSVAGATKYLVSVGTTPGATDEVNKFDNGGDTSYFFSFGLMPSTTYYVTVTPVNQYGEAVGCTSSSFTTGAAVANDVCSTAKVIASLPFNQMEDGTYASDTTSPAECAGSGYMNDGMWYEITGDGGNIKVTVSPTATWDAAIMVKEGTCDEANCLATADAGSYGAAETLTIPNSVAGKKYYINVGASSIIDFEEGKFIFNISSDRVLGTTETSYQDRMVAAYPNPVKETLFLKNTGNNASYQIFDMSGKAIMKGLYKNGINVNQLGYGVYFIKVNNTSVKFIKK